MRNYLIKSNDKKVQDSINDCNEKIIEILDFFDVDNVNIEIKVLDYNAFKKEFKNYLKYA